MLCSVSARYQSLWSSDELFGSSTAHWPSYAHGPSSLDDDVCVTSTSPCATSVPFARAQFADVVEVSLFQHLHSQCRRIVDSRYLQHLCSSFFLKTVHCSERAHSRASLGFENPVILTSCASLLKRLSLFPFGSICASSCLSGSGSTSVPLVVGNFFEFLM